MLLFGREEPRCRDYSRAQPASSKRAAAQSRQQGVPATTSIATPSVPHSGQVAPCCAQPSQRPASIRATSTSVSASRSRQQRGQYGRPSGPVFVEGDGTAHPAHAARDTARFALLPGTRDVMVKRYAPPGRDRIRNGQSAHNSRPVPQESQPAPNSRSQKVGYSPIRRAAYLRHGMHRPGMNELRTRPVAIHR